ncbi:MAG: hypothetical protein ACD_5C00047G0004 [uncultured bacterium]|nr:MAG: hypothetical protein ACD_5C00047G0004 [uncultured bacterium]
MKFILEVNNKTPQKVSKKTFLGVFKNTLEIANFEFLKDKSIELSIALVSSDEIKTLNKDYRRKNKPTDVLSFGDFDKRDLLLAEAERADDIFLGEIILCPEYIAKNAQEDNETFQYALNYITSHGILHLMGFPHGKKMFTMQRNVADMLK